MRSDPGMRILPLELAVINYYILHGHILHRAWTLKNPKNDHSDSRALWYVLSFSFYLIFACS